ncbi:MAG: hypothetical protein Q8R55_02435, partial [Candidatus Taylorbacteria bacterium]|nr:hypothetical protein [Candidatus Taylorbacteria bacterium]
TSIRDDSIGGDTNNDGFSSGAPGDWNQITIAAGSVTNLNSTVIRFGSGGWPHYSNISLSGGSLLMSNSVISSGSTGLRIYDGWANIANSAITNNSYGITIEGGGTAISNSSIYGNTEYGLYNGTFVEINAENIWWGDATGPYNFWNNSGGQGDKISTWIDYEPWLTAPPISPPDPISSKEPVIIVPGILGSRLNRVSDGEEVWPSIAKMANPLTPDDNYLDELKLDNNGNEILDMNSPEIIESVASLNQYGNLIQIFRDNGYELGQDLFVMPYDWRLDIEVSSNELDSIVNQALANSPTGKVNIIAHSMGGLLVKDYMTRNGDSAVNKLIFAGTPHLGAPKAFNLLNWGDDFDLKFLIFGLNKNKAKEIGQNMPAVYQLLPSREYITKAGPYVKDDNSTDLNYAETNQFMTSSQLLTDHRNSDLLTHADQFHQSHDGWVPQSANVYNLLGCREYDTIGYFSFDSDGSVDINSITGDGTVPLASAKHIPGENYYVLYPATKINHMGLVSDDRTISLMYDIITDSPPLLPNGISKDDGYCDQVIVDVRRLRFSTHSPVNLHVFDGLGNHTGLTPEGNIEMNIPDSNFIQVGDSSFVFVPEGAEYSVRIEAYATGSFDFKVKELINGQVKDSIIYDSIPIDNPNLEADFEFIDITNLTALNLDREGDGVVDAGYLPDGSWIPHSATVQSTLVDIEYLSVLGWIRGDIKNSLINLLKATEATTRSKGRQANGVLGTAFLKQLETEYNKGNINEKAFNIIKADILWLLGN